MQVGRLNGKNMKLKFKDTIKFKDSYGRIIFGMISKIDKRTNRITAMNLADPCMSYTMPKNDVLSKIVEIS